MHLKWGHIKKNVKCSTISSINRIKEGIPKMFGHVEHRASDALVCKCDWIQVGEMKSGTTKFTWTDAVKRTWHLYTFWTI